MIEHQQTPTPPTPAEPYLSLPAIRDVHRDLLRRFRSEGPTEQMAADVLTFVNRTSATGLRIDAEDDRWAAQNMIDYWSTMLYRWGHQGFDATLDDYDFSYVPELKDDMCPYLGLNAFSEDQQGKFYGRQRLVTQVVENLRLHHFAAVIGPSGSGKSSLAQAGVLPVLKNGAISTDSPPTTSQNWLYLPAVIPTADPLATLAKAILPPTAAGQDYAQQINALRLTPSALLNALDQLVQANGQTTTAVLFVDEFEELFTQCQDEEMRQQFMANLLHVAQSPTNTHVLLIAMHSDYEALCDQWPELKKLLNLATVRITPPNSAELREVIERPAAIIDLRFDEGLVNRLLQDVGSEHSALPLLQFTLLRLWDCRDHNRITWDAYNQVGSGRNSLVTAANDFYRDLLPEERLTFKHIFLRFVVPTELGGVNMLRLPRAELQAVGGSAERIDAMLAKLVAVHLVRQNPGATPAADEFDLVHEALAHDWSLFVEWLDDERIKREQRLRLNTAVKQWLNAGREKSRLRRGNLLTESLAYLNDPTLTPLEREFLQVSQAEEERREREKAEEEKHKLAMAENLAAAEQNLRKQQESSLKIQRLISAILAGMFVIAVLASVVAYNQRNQAVGQTNLAQTKEAEAVVAQTTAVAALAEAQTQAQLARSAESDARQSQSEAQIQARAARLAEAEALASAREARLAANLAATAQAAAETSALRALAGQLAAQAYALRQEQTDLSLLLTLHALDTADTPEGRSILLATLQGLSREATLARQLSITGHNERVFTVAYSPDGQWLASGGYDNAVRLWNPTTGEAIGRPLFGHTNWVRRVVFNEDGTVLASASYDSSVILWDMTPLSTGGQPTQLTTLRGHRDAVNAAVFIPSTNPTSGRYMATASQDGTIVIWNITDLRQPIRFATLQGGHRGKVYALAASPDGQTLISAGADRKIMFWDITNPGRPSTPFRILEEHSAEVNALALSADGNTLASGDDSGVIMVWNARTGERLGSLLGHANWILSLDFAPTSPYLLSTSRDNSLILWDWQALERVSGPFTSHNDWVWEAQFAPDGQAIASASRDGSILLWALQTNPQLSELLDTFDQPILDAAYQDSNHLTLLFPDAVLFQPIELEGPAARYDLPNAADFATLALSADGQMVVGTQQNQLVLWPDATAAEPPIPLGTQTGLIAAATFSANGRWVASVGCADPLSATVAGDEPAEEDGGDVLPPCTQSELYVWDVATQTAAFPPVPVPDAELVSVAFSPDGTLLAAAGCLRNQATSAEGGASPETEDKAICVQGQTWVWATGAALSLRYTLTTTADNLAQTDTIAQLAFAPDNQLLVTGANNNTLVFWEMATGQALTPPLDGHNGLFSAMRFSPDGQILATAGTDRTILLWDTAARQRLALPLQAHSDTVTALAFTLDSGFLATVGLDGQAHEWGASLATWRELACIIANRPLTELEWQSYGSVGEFSAVCGE